MYAERELNRLNAVKSVVRGRIARRRIETSAQIERVARPVRWVDRAYVYWKKAGPIARFAAAPITAWLASKLFGRRKRAGSLMRWVPTIWNVVRGFQQGWSGHRAA